MLSPKERSYDVIMNIARVFALVLVVTMAMVAGCKTEKVRSDQLVGVWRIEGSDRIGSKPAATATTLSLDSSGKLVAISLPSGFIRIDGMKPEQALSGTGTWSLIDHGERVLLVFTSIEGSNGQGLPYGAELFVQKSGSGFCLFYFDGDPDEDRRILFTRESVRR